MRKVTLRLYRNRLERQELLQIERSCWRVCGLPANVAVFSEPESCLALPKSVNKICPMADSMQFSGLRSLQ